MKNSVEKLRNFFTPTVISFIAGFIISLVTSLIAENLINKTIPNSSDIIVILMIVFILFSITALAIIRDDIRKEWLNSSFEAKIYYTSDRDSEKALYAELCRTVASASESIRSISLSRRVDLETASHRKVYYRTLNEIIEQRVKQNKDFKYDRIVQVKTTDTNGYLHSDQLDVLMRDHCKNLTNLLPIAKRSKVRIRLRQISDEPSPVSFVIVDRKSIVFLIPPITRDQNEKIRSHIGMGIFFTDPKGIVINSMEDIFDNLISDSEDVKEIKIV